MQPPILTPHRGGAQDETLAARLAWSLAADGFEQAMQVSGLSVEERASLLRCYRSCAAAAQRPLLRSALPAQA